MVSLLEELDLIPNDTYIVVRQNKKTLFIGRVKNLKPNNLTETCQKMWLYKPCVNVAPIILNDESKKRTEGLELKIVDTELSIEERVDKHGNVN